MGMMNANLADLFDDAVNALRLRYRADVHEYRYGLPVFAAVLLGVGALQAAQMSPLLGSSAGATALGMLLGVSRYLLFTRVITEVMYRFTKRRIAFLGYTLATEALTLPALLLLPFPEMQPLAGLWGLWCTWVQFAGVAVFSQQSMMRTLAAYLLYLPAMLLLGALLMNLFVAAGWLDLDLIQANLERYMRTVSP